MRGVILAGGFGTRLGVVTEKVTNKHLLLVYNLPMIFYPIRTLVTAGITEVLLVTSGPHVGDFLGVLKNGKELGLKSLQYAYQEKADGGIADALSLAEDFAGGDGILTILGDNIYDEDFSEQVKSFKSGARVFLKEAADPTRFGVANFDKAGRIVKIQEKPKKPKSSKIVTGLYLYDSQIFDIIRTLKPSGRMELEITDANNEYIKREQLDWSEVKNFWSDAGQFDSLLYASNYWANKNDI